MCVVRLGLPANLAAVGGWICLAAALLMVVAALQKVPNPALVKLIALGNLGWVAASFAVVATVAVQMTGLGIAVVVAPAFAVLGFAILQLKAVAPPPVAPAPDRPAFSYCLVEN